jgi:hypothetical protein
MAIYGRFGHELTIERMATLADIKPLTGRKPDKIDRESLERGSYVVVVYKDDGKRDLYHLGYLRADGGWSEIQAAIDASTSTAKKGRGK